MVKDLVEQLLLPLLASNISLLFALISRNGMVSQRIREACKELASAECSIERGICLNSQITAFENRYRLNKWAISSVLIAVALHLLARVFSMTPGPLEVFGIMSIIAFIAAISMTLYDFARATETLDQEINFSKGIQRKRASAADQDARSTKQK